MTITTDQWHAAADHVKRVEELDEYLAFPSSDFRVALLHTPLDDVLSDEACDRVYAAINNELQKARNQAAVELQERYGVVA